jgi:hypothetical protein
VSKLVANCSSLPWPEQWAVSTFLRLNTSGQACHEVFSNLINRTGNQLRKENQTSEDGKTWHLALIQKERSLAAMVMCGGHSKFVDKRVTFKIENLSGESGSHLFLEGC